MAFQVSPAVTVNEADLTNIIPAISSSIAAVAGDFQWGPVSEITTISREDKLVQTFGKPTDTNFAHFFSAASFLLYGADLRVVRANNTGAYNSTTKGTSTTVNIRNQVHYDSQTFDAATVGSWAAKYPGALGNSLKISYYMADFGSPTEDYDDWTYQGYFNSPPGTSTYAASLGATSAGDEMHIVIIDEDGLISGVPGTVLEKYGYVSLAYDAKTTDGASNYFKNVINNTSKYVWFLGNSTLLTNHQAGLTVAAMMAADPLDHYGSPSLTHYETLSFTFGADGTAATQGEIAQAYDLFADTETLDLNLIIGGPTPVDTLQNATAHANYINNIAATRHDCIAFVSPPTTGTYGTVGATNTTGVITWANTLASSSFGVIDSTAVRIYDKYNDVFRWIPASGHMAGLAAHTDRVTDPWWSPAGYNRGVLRNVVSLAYNPDKTDRDALYKARINPLVQFPQESPLLFGDKTAQTKPGAFDRINVRRLFNHLEKAIATAAKYMLFEFNDEFTRAQFRNMVEPFLRDVKGRRGVTDFKVVCDESNNTGEVIDRNEFVADIYIKPARSINYITLNFIATRTGVAFEEIIGKTFD